MSSSVENETEVAKSSTGKLSRRALLRNAGVAGAAAVAGAKLAGGAEASPGSLRGARTAPNQDAVELTLNARTGSESAIFDGLISQFTEQNPNIKIKGQYFTPTNQEYFQKVAVLIAGGTEGDMIWMSSIEGYYDYASRGTWLPIDDYVTRDAIDASQWYPAAFEMMKLNGASYALPLWSHPSIVGLYYNKDLFDAAGLAYPDDTWTTDTLATSAGTLTKRDGDDVSVFGYFPAYTYFNGLCQVLPSFGGKALSDDGKTMTFDQPESQQAIQWLTDLFQTNKVAPTPGANVVGNDLMLSQKLAMMAGGYWVRWGASATWEFNWDVAAISKGPGGSTGAMLQTDAVPISKSTKNPDQAWEFQKFITSKDAGMFLWNQNYLPGSRPDVWEDPTLLADKTHVIWADQMKVASPLVYPANFRFREFEIAINQTMNDAWIGSKSAADAIAATTKAGQEILDKDPA